MRVGAGIVVCGMGLALVAGACGQFEAAALDAGTPPPDAGVATGPDGTNLSSDASESGESGGSSGSVKGPDDAGVDVAEAGGSSGSPGGPQPGDVTCYQDGDGDTYLSKKTARTFNPACAAGWFPAPPSGSYDCDDTSANARPGQIKFFSMPTPGGGSDYDCNGKVELKGAEGLVLDCHDIDNDDDCYAAARPLLVDGVAPKSMADLTCGSTVEAVSCWPDHFGGCTTGAAVGRFTTHLTCR